MNITTSLPVIPPGEAVEGGFFLAHLPRIDGSMCRLVLPPKAEADFSGVTWKESIAAVAGLEGCKLLGKLSGMAAFTLLGPNHETTPEHFRTGGSEAFEPTLYWLEEKYEFVPNYAWDQYFGGGTQGAGAKYHRGRCRAVREFLI